MPITRFNGNDLDDGPNELQNFPVFATEDITPVAEADKFTIEATLDSPPGDFRIEVFTGQGKAFLDVVAISASDFDINGKFTFTIDYTGQAIDKLSATATSIIASVLENTSELSPSVALPGDGLADRGGGMATNVNFIE